MINLSVVLNLRTTEKLALQLSNSNLKETMRSPLQLAKKKNHTWWKGKRLSLKEVLGAELFCFFLPTNNSAVHTPPLNGVLVVRVCIRIPLKATPGHFTHQVKMFWPQGCSKLLRRSTENEICNASQALQRTVNGQFLVVVGSCLPLATVQ